MFLRRNTAGQVFVVPGALRATADGAAVTSATIRVCKDGTWASGSGTLTHDATGNAGVYTYAPTQAETDCAIFGWQVTGTGAIPLAGSVRTTNADPNDGTRLGLTALPNAAAGANGGLPTGNSSGQVTVVTNNDKTGYTVSTVSDKTGYSLAANQDVRNVTGTISDKTGYVLASAPPTAQQIWEYATRTLTAFGFDVTVDTNNDKTGYSLSATPPSASAIADAVWDEARTGHTNSGTFGLYLDAQISGASGGGGGGGATAQQVWEYGTRALTDKSDFALSSSERSSVATAVWGAGSRTLSSFGTLVSDVVSGVWAAGTRTLSAFGFTVSTSSDSNVTAIKAKTDNLPASPASVADIPTTAQVADKVLGRNIAGGSDGGRTVRQTLAIIRNKVEIEGTIIRVYAEDDTTLLFTGTVTAAPGANPISAIDWA